MNRDLSPVPGFEPSIGLLMAGLDDSTREWREELGEVSDEAIVWQPVSGSYSIGALYLHLIEVESAWFEDATGVRAIDPVERKLLMSDEIDVDAGIWPVPPQESLDWYHDLHMKIRTRARGLVQEIDPGAEFGNTRKVTWRWIVTHVLQHDAYTGGQMVVLHELWKRMK